MTSDGAACSRRYRTVAAIGPQRRITELLREELQRNLVPDRSISHRDNTTSSSHERQYGMRPDVESIGSDEHQHGRRHEKPTRRPIDQTDARPTASSAINRGNTGRMYLKNRCGDSVAPTMPPTQSAPEASLHGDCLAHSECSHFRGPSTTRRRASRTAAAARCARQSGPDNRERHIETALGEIPVRRAHAATLR